MGPNLCNLPLPDNTHQCGHLLRDHAANRILLILVVVFVIVVGWNEEHFRDDLAITLVVAWWSHVGKVGHNL